MFIASITWNYSLLDHTGFLLQRSIDSGSVWSTNYALPSSIYSYLDAAIVPYGSYWYRVAATNRYGTGSWSNIGYVFVPPAIPDGPYDLTVSSGSSILTWKSGSSGQEYFAIQTALDNTPSSFTNLGVSLVIPYTDSFVSSSETGNTYWYQVAAVNISGTSSFTNTASILFGNPPPPPYDLISVSGSGSFFL